MADVVPIYVVPIPSLLHQKNIGVTYAGTSIFKMEPIKFVQVYSMAMPYSIIIITKAPFVSTPICIVDGVKSRSQILRGI